MVSPDGAACEPRPRLDCQTIIARPNIARHHRWEPLQKKKARRKSSRDLSRDEIATSDVPPFMDAAWPEGPTPEGVRQWGFEPSSTRLTPIGSRGNPPGRSCPLDPASKRERSLGPAFPRSGGRVDPPPPL